MAAAATPSQWRKSSLSADLGNCVEVAIHPRMVRIRDSKDPFTGVLTVGTRDWAVFLAGVKHGDFDLTVADLS